MATQRNDEEKSARWMDDFLVFGRPLKPFALGMTITALLIGWANLTVTDRGTQPPLSYVVAVLGVLAAGLLVIAWILNSRHAFMVGFASIVLVYMTRAVFIQMNTPWDNAVYFSLITVGMAAGAYTMESLDKEPGGGRGDRGA